MDEQREHIVEDLSGDFRGEVRCDDLAVSMFASDASLFEVRPLGVAFPRDRDDVATLSPWRWQQPHRFESGDRPDR